ncbi:hypothetical protein J6590_033633 [Homalodisca vitripennis]|nr:hypothetical protein J6590_033633 [Homalodisca vitripennis]
MLVFKEKIKDELSSSSVSSGAAGLAELRRRQEAGQSLYPNYDTSTYMWTSQGRGNVEAVNAVRQILDTSGAAGLAELRRRQEAGEPLYPNYDTSTYMWTRQQILDTSGAAGLAELKRRQEAGESLYPNYDTSTYMRNCEKEIFEPIHGKTTVLVADITFVLSDEAYDTD